MERSNRKPAVVLLVDDDAGDQELTRRALADGMYKVDLRITSDGEEALDYLYRRGRFDDSALAPAPDLILLDLNMPRVDGRQVLKSVKADPRLRSLPIVVLTTSQHETDVLQSYSLGCNSFVTKPVTVEGFVTALRELGSYWFELVTLCERAPDTARLVPADAHVG